MVSSRLKSPRSLILPTAVFPVKSSLIESLIIWGNDKNTTTNNNRIPWKVIKLYVNLKILPSLFATKEQDYKQNRLFYTHEMSL